MAAADRERQPAGRQPDHTGPRDRGGLHGRYPGRSDPVDLGRGPGRSRGAQGQHQPNDRQPPRDHSAQRRAGLAEDQPGEHLGNAPGPARPGSGHPADHERDDPDGERPTRRVLPGRAERRRRDRARARGVLRLRVARRRAPRPLRDRGGPRRPGRVRAQDDLARQHPGRIPQGRLRPRRGDRGIDHRDARPVRGSGAGRDRAGFPAAVL